MKKTKLKKCPFCKSKKALKGKEDNSRGLCINYAVVCSVLLGGCGTTSGYERTPEEAINTWNTRGKQ